MLMLFRLPCCVAAVFQVAVERPGMKKARRVIKGLSERGTNQTMFFNEEAKHEMSVADYFKTHYKLSLVYPFLPCVDVSTDRSRKVWLPMEICR